MRRIWKFLRPSPPAAPETWQLSHDQHQQLLDLLSEIGLDIVDEARGPVPLLTFGRRVMERLDARRPTSLPLFADALKHIIRDMAHDRLRVMSPTNFLGVGYVYNADDPETWPVRTRRPEHAGAESSGFARSAAPDLCENAPTASDPPDPPVPAGRPSSPCACDPSTATAPRHRSL